MVARGSQRGGRYRRTVAKPNGELAGSGWRLRDCTWDFWWWLAFDERQQVGIDRVRFRSGHAVREALVGFQGCVLQQLSGQRPGGDIGHDLVVFAMHDQHRDGDLLEVS